MITVAGMTLASADTGSSRPLLLARGDARPSSICEQTGPGGSYMSARLERRRLGATMDRDRGRDRRGWLALGAACIAFVLAACGPSDPPPPTNPRAETPSTAT